MNIRSVTGIWLTFQGPHPWRKLILSTPAVFCHHQLLRQGWALGTHPPTHGNVDCVGFVREPQMQWVCACDSPAKVQKTLSSSNSLQPLGVLNTLIYILIKHSDLNPMRLHFLMDSGKHRCQHRAEAQKVNDCTRLMPKCDICISILLIIIIN